jgi:catechol 2,3-dioxygenase-like lactoylglutathione lyase family enzyme
MLEHVTVPVSGYMKSKIFYLKLLAPLGYENTMEFGEAAGFMEGDHTSFWIEKTDTVIPTHVAFLAKSKENVQKFHTAGLAAGGTDNGAPGFRTDYGPDYYTAYILDPDGNNIEACYFGERADART